MSAEFAAETQALIDRAVKKICEIFDRIVLTDVTCALECEFGETSAPIPLAAVEKAISESLQGVGTQLVESVQRTLARPGATEIKLKEQLLAVFDEVGLEYADREAA